MWKMCIILHKYHVQILFTKYDENQKKIIVYKTNYNTNLYETKINTFVFKKN